MVEYHSTSISYSQIFVSLCIEELSLFQGIINHPEQIRVRFNTKLIAASFGLQSSILQAEPNDRNTWDWHFS
jgi:hypothetical protein